MMRHLLILLLSTAFATLLAQSTTPTVDDGKVYPLTWTTPRFLADSMAQESSYPMLAVDGQTLYFSRHNHPRNVGLTDAADVWRCEKEPDGNWGVPFHLGVAINTNETDRLIGIDASETSLLLYERDSSGIVISQRKGRTWAPPKTMTFAGMEIWPTTASVAMGPHASIMIISQPTGNNGEQDLYISRRLSEWVWGPLTSLGSTINSEQDELACWLAADLQSLYFASNRPGGQGGFDLYVSRRLDDSWEKWTLPVNLGFTINTAADERQLSVSAEGNTAVMMRETEGKEQLFTVELPLSCYPKPVTLVKVNLLGTSYPQYLKLSPADPTLPSAYLYTDQNGQLGYVAPLGKQPLLQTYQRDLVSVPLTFLADASAEEDLPETAMLVSLKADEAYQRRETTIANELTRFNALDEQVRKMEVNDRPTLDK
ncbi:MAG: hypothetical protein AAF840_06015, partial [Bacteroidota bacterium]